MKPQQTLYCKDTDSVTISATEYQKLLNYKEFALELREILSGDDV